MSVHRQYKHAQDIDVLSIPKRSLGDGHDIRVVTILQGVGNEGVERFAGGGKVMFGTGTVHHFAGAGKMVGKREVEGPFSPSLFITARVEAERSVRCC